MNLVCFDYDGVIADTLDYQLNVLIELYKLHGFGRMPVLKDLQKIENLSFPTMALRLGVKSSELDLWLSAVNDILRIEKHDQFFSGIKETLEKIGENSHLAIVTHNIKIAVEKAFKDHNIDLPLNIYDNTLGLDKGERILLACKDLSIDISKTYMVGDARSDIKFGKEVGAHTIAVTWGFQTKETLMKENPDYIIDTPSELLKILS